MNQMRAQLWSLDFISSVVIFSFALIILMSAWSYATTQNASQMELRLMDADALAVSDQLIRVSGMPDDWTSSNFHVLGLAEKDNSANSSRENILNESKILEFLGISYDDVRKNLGIGDYEFNLTIMYLNGTLKYTFGKNPANERLLVPVERYCLLNGAIVRLDVMLWKTF